MFLAGVANSLAFSFFFFFFFFFFFSYGWKPGARAQNLRSSGTREKEETTS